MPLWVLDEPFTALDVSATQLLRQKIEQFANDGGLVVVTSHQTFSMNVPNFVQLQLDAKVNLDGVINLDEVKN